LAPELSATSMMVLNPITFVYLTCLHPGAV